MIARILITLLVLTGPLSSAPLDILMCCDQASESQHGLSADRSDVVVGETGRKARRLLPPVTENWRGGTISFTAEVNPGVPNYLTVRFRSSDVTQGRLILLCEGKQVGYRHLGDVDLLDTGSEEAGSPGAFLDRTIPLPEALTKGKTRVVCEIRATGRIWGYGTDFAQYQKPMTEPSRAIYAVVTHTEPLCPLPVWAGAANKTPSIRTSPGVEVMDDVKKRVAREINGILGDKRPPNQLQMHLLARAWFVPWTAAHKNPKVLSRIILGVDTLHASWLENPRLAEGDPAVYNKEWFSFGMAADAVRLLADPLKDRMSETLPSGVTRRKAWADLFFASREFLRTHRRAYTNQAMIVDLNVFRSNSALQFLDPGRAFDNAAALRYPHEAAGLRPWLGSDTPNGPAKPLGDSYMQLTERGLTRELGYVGNYGEVIDWVMQLYDATRLPGQPGDPALKQQLERISEARSVFRYPALDAEGNRAMRLETVVGWRDDHFPGDVCYNQRDSWDASAISAAATTLDPASVGRARQMFADNQFFVTVREQLKQSGLRTTSALLDIPEHYEVLKAQKDSGTLMPMSEGMPDFAFADEENGVVAVKHQGEILYASLYWRARYGINNLARVHLLTAQTSRIAVVRQETQFEDSGMTYKRPNWTNMAFGNGGIRYPGDPPSAHAGEILPIAKIPDGLAFKPGQENIHAGKASFYQMRYGRYLIGMNTTTDKTFTLRLPPGTDKARELVRPRELQLSAPLELGPRSTAVVLLVP